MASKILAGRKDAVGRYGDVLGGFSEGKTRVIKGYDDAEKTEGVDA